MNFPMRRLPALLVLALVLAGTLVGSCEPRGEAPIHSTAGARPAAAQSVALDETPAPVARTLPEPPREATRAPCESVAAERRPSEGTLPKRSAPPSTPPPVPEPPTSANPLPTTPPDPIAYAVVPKPGAPNFDWNAEVAESKLCTRLRPVSATSTEPPLSVSPRGWMN